MGWPLRPSAQYREFGGSFIYPMGDDMVTLGMVVGLDYRDVELSVHDLLQELKTHPLVRELLDGGERVAWGAKTIPEGGLLSLPKRLHAPGLLLCGDGAGLRQRARRSRASTTRSSRGGSRPRRRFAGAAAGRGAVAAGALASYDEAVRESFVWKDLQECATCARRSAAGFWLGGALAGAMTATKGHVPAGRRADGARRRAGADRDRPREELSGAGREADVRQALVASS